MSAASPGTGSLIAAANQPAWINALVRYKSLIVPIAMVAMVGVIVVPLPPFVMDILLSLNITIAAVVLLTVIYVEEPLQLSVFPSLLLFVTLFRLTLNIATTRLILSADATTAEGATNVAGKVVQAFGDFVAGSSLVVGIILFVIIVIVQFVVITKGATRIGEVAARFTLDAMPGKQLAIDADLNAGLIDEKQAKYRRERLGQEADFFGAMDGAGKFVRGDAIAGIIITLINIAGGFAIGVFVNGWPAASAAEVFTKLTIGDGLSSQLPALIISIAAGLLVTRSGSTKSSLGDDIVQQVIARPTALFITAGFLGALALTPLPAIPLLAASGSLTAIGLTMRRGSRAQAERVLAEQRQAEAPAAAEPTSVESLLKVDAMELEVGYGLVPLVDAKQGGDLLERIAATRRQLAIEMGLVMPPVRIRDNMSLDGNSYRVKIRGAVIAEGRTEPNRLLAIDSGLTSGRIEGASTKEPAFGLDAWWIDPQMKARAETLNYTVVDATSVLSTHLTEIVKNHADELLTREEVNNLLTQLKEKSPKLVEEVVPSIVKVGDLQTILQALLRERVPIRDMETVLETLGDWGTKTKDTDVLVEYVRHGLRRIICQQHIAPGAAQPGEKPKLVCVTLDPALEDLVNAHVDRSGGATSINMPARTANAIARSVMDALTPVVNGGHSPVVIASPQVRAVVRQIVQPHLPNVVVLGYNEIVPEIEVESMGLVGPPPEQVAGGDARNRQHTAA
ncbi:MAG: flagellar biosynthesis protein FlhA [Phycisphaerales bacterium]